MSFTSILQGFRKYWWSSFFKGQRLLDVFVPSVNNFVSLKQFLNNSLIENPIWIVVEYLSSKTLFHIENSQLICRLVLVFIWYIFLLKRVFKQTRPGLKIYWFAVTRPGLQETCGPIFFFFFDAHSWKKMFSDKHIILAMIKLNFLFKVNFLLFLLHHFLSVRIVLTFLTHCPLRRFHKTALH